MPRLGVIGTMVWDSIYGPHAGPDDAVEAWGGIAYSLAAADAASRADWTLLPLIKVGGDLGSEARRFFATLPRIDSLDGVREVPESNNRVDLYYHKDDHERRCERLTGGVPGWTADELLPLVASCDALYINFIAGWELDLEVASALRTALNGPMYVDVHSLMLGIGEDGIRRLRPLPEWKAWLDNFDYVQLNEDELETLAKGDVGPEGIVPEILGQRTRAVFVTRGERGVEWTASSHVAHSPRSGFVEPSVVIPDADPTGCGDVWGATCFASLLGGDDVESAAGIATVAAERNARIQGASGLHRLLVAGPVS